MTYPDWRSADPDWTEDTGRDRTVSETRIVVEQECEHGLTFGPHPTEGMGECLADCPGGRRRYLIEGDYVLIEADDDGLWPESVQRRLYDFASKASGLTASDLLDALAKHEGTE